MRLAQLVTVSLLTFAAAACGSAASRMGGGRPVTQDYAKQSKASYKSGACVNVADGASSKSPSATYHLVEDAGKPALFERSEKGHHTLIGNHWSDADGEHYFLSVSAPMHTLGYHYLFPKEGTPTRLMYQDAGVETGADGVARPTGKASNRCELTPLTP